MKQKDTVKEHIKKMIGEGVLIPGQYAPSERAICKLLNVSRVTARNALNELVADNLLVNLPKKGYLLPKANQNSNDKNIKDSILFLHEHDEENFLADFQHNEIWKGAREVAVQSGYNIKISPLPKAQFNLKTVVEIKELYAGVVCDYIKKEFLDHLLELNVPLVQIHGSTPNLNTVKIVQNDLEGAVQATDYLIKLTNKKVGIVELSDGLNQINKSYHNDRRLAGWYMSHFTNQIKVSSADIISDNFNTPNYKKIAEKILKAKFTSIFIPFGPYIVGIQKELNKLSANASANILWATWGKPPQSPNLVEPVAHIQWNYQAMGREGAQEVIKMINTGIRDAKTILVPSYLIINEQLNKKKQ
jgi:DNA-binding LacI/PurR family transcriptional regulator